MLTGSIQAMLSASFVFFRLSSKSQVLYLAYWHSAHGRQHIAANGVSWTAGKMHEKLKSENMQKEQFSMFMLYILRAIRAGRCRQRRYADHIFIHIYFRMHHFVVKFSKFSSPQATRGHWPHNQNPADVPDSASFYQLWTNWTNSEINWDIVQYCWSFVYHRYTVSAYSCSTQCRTNQSTVHTVQSSLNWLNVPYD